MQRYVVLILALAASTTSGSLAAQRPSVTLARHPASSVIGYGQARSWMVPAASSGDLLYVTNANSKVTVYSYPQGQLVGTLSGFGDPYGVCVDTSANVYITDRSFGDIVEYAHGGTKPLRTIKDLEYRPQGCAIDPATGDLAVANYETGWNYPGNLSVYRKARGFARSYIVEDFYYYFYCAYDGSGNAYVNGQFGSYGEGFEFAQLPKKGSTLNQILLPGNLGYPAGIAWDGTYVAVGDQTAPNIYEFAFAKGKATLKNTTTLSGADQILGFAIDGATLIAPNQLSSGNSNVLFYNYPAGGAPTQTITNGVFFPRAVAISPGSTRK
jgi:hypothetical protein